MNPLAIVSFKALSAAGAAAILGVAGAGVLAQAASPSPNPPSTTAPHRAAPDVRTDRRAIRRAVVEAEADVLGIKPQTLVKDLRAGQTVSELAKAKGLSENQFEARLLANLKPRLETLVDRKVITQAQADRVIAWIAKGHIPFWNGVHRRR